MPQLLGFYLSKVSVKGTLDFYTPKSLGRCNGLNDGISLV